MGAGRQVLWMEGTGRVDSDPCRQVILDLYTRMQFKETRDETRGEDAHRHTQAHVVNTCGFA